MATQRGNLQRPPMRRGASLALSAVLHLTVVAAMAATAQSLAAPERTEVRYLVAPSEARTAAREQPAAEPPPVATATETEPPLPPPPVDDAAEPWPERPTPPDAETRTPPRRLDEVLAANVILRPLERAPVAEPPAAASTSEARPEVPVALPGFNLPPDYPAGAIRRRIEGTVVVRIEIDAAGFARHCSVALGSGSVLLDAAALTAAGKWRFDRGPGTVEVPFVFRLTDRG
ncbi:MAG: TonB family protein [Planctomycetes bacterium]|nr:TonB family protein [Planctomycetota bacterium]